MASQPEPSLLSEITTRRFFTRPRLCEQFDIVENYMAEAARSLSEMWSISYSDTWLRQNSLV